jgi:WhiB family redox-sensing transcriptional regulator
MIDMIESGERTVVPGASSDYAAQQQADTMANRQPMSEEAHTYEGEDAWRNYAECRGIDPAIMFPINGPGVDVAKGVCAKCVSIDPCLEEALTKREVHGVWGGASERERRRILRRRRQSI